MWNRPITIECKYCKVKEVYFVSDFSDISTSFNSINFFAIPHNIQCKKCFRVADVYVKDDTE